MITGPLTGAGQPGRFPANTFFTDPQLPDREQPFREFTIMYHDEIGAVQAFPEFFRPTDPTNPKIVPVEGLIDIGLGFTLHGAVDGFGINYGVAGIGAEVLANRLKVGPEANCAECKYEEFFLSSWTIGDPAQIVDIPANTRDANGAVIPGPKATKVLYPDDPSNVYHSYIRDHTKFRILHGGVKEHHIHHQHAHQWVHTPNSNNSSYDDSQAIGPGAAFTLEMTYNGGGNRNQVVGDSIFHCHFYPHFGQGMWALWRTHDVFEAGTQLDANGRPVPGSRAYPDGEIPTGSPIPGAGAIAHHRHGPDTRARRASSTVRLVCRRRLPSTPAIHSLFQQLPATVRHTRRCSRSLTADCRGTSSQAPLTWRSTRVLISPRQ